MDKNLKDNLNLLLSSNNRARKHYFVCGEIELSSLKDIGVFDKDILSETVFPKKVKECEPDLHKKKAIDEFIRNNKKKAFVDLLYEYLEEKGMSNAECYNKVNIDGRSFNKIINVPNYLPQKGTIFALAISLELNLDETEEFLNAAGRSIDYSNDRDLIVCFYIQNGYYDIGEIDDELQTRHLKPLVKYDGNKTKSQD